MTYSKEDFIRCFLRPKITLCFSEAEFRENNRIVIRECKVTLEEAGNYFCPWYYDVETNREYNKGIIEVLKEPQARAATIKEVGNKVQFRSQEEKIRRYKEEWVGKTEECLCPFPIATDTTASKTLVLDGNKTLVALYQSWNREKKIPVIEVYGPNLIVILPADFCIVYRS